MMPSSPNCENTLNSASASRASLPRARICSINTRAVNNLALAISVRNCAAHCGSRRRRMRAALSNDDGSSWRSFILWCSARGLRFRRTTAAAFPDPNASGILVHGQESRNVSFGRTITARCGSKRDYAAFGRRDSSTIAANRRHLSSKMRTLVGQSIARYSAASRKPVSGWTVSNRSIHSASEAG